MKRLSEYYRLPDTRVQFGGANGDGDKAGFFTFGEDSVCFGRCSCVPVARTPEHPVADAFQYARIGENSVYLPFNLDDIADNLHNERYTLPESARRMQMFMQNAYYRLRPA